MFSNDERFSHVFDGAVTAKPKGEKILDLDKMAAQAKAFAAQRAKAEAEGKSVGGGEGEGDDAGGGKRKRKGGGGSDGGAKKAAAGGARGDGGGEDRPPFALKPSNEALLKKIVTVATFVAKNGQKFEEVTKQKQEGNAEFTFLFGGEGEEYYKWLKYATKAGINPDAPPGATPGFDPVALAEAARKIAEAAAAASSGGAGAAGAGAASEQPAAAAAAAVPAAPAPAPVTQAGGWQAVKDATGRTYYWNKDTNSTTWDPPPGF